MNRVNHKHVAALLEGLRDRSLWQHPDRLVKEFRACLETLVSIDKDLGKVLQENASLKAHVRNIQGPGEAPSQEALIRQMAASIYTHAVSTMVDTYALDFTESKLRTIRDNAYDAARAFFDDSSPSEDRE